MGMAASQVRLLQLTSRKNTIGYNLQCLSLEKVSLAREMKNYTKDYQNALSTKVLKWSNNSGVSFVDLSYSNMMKPSSVNQSKPYMITDASSRVVIDENYEKYAKMISPTGSPAGDWMSNRVQILSELTGVSTDKLELYATTKENVKTAVDNVNDLQSKIDKIKANEPTKKGKTPKQLFDSVGVVQVGSKSYNLSDLYKPGSRDTIEVGNGVDAQATLIGLLDGISIKLESSLLPEDIANFRKACNDYVDGYEQYFKGDKKKPVNNNSIGIKEDGGKFFFNMSAILDEVLGHYKSLSKSGESYGYNKMHAEVFYVRDLNDPLWITWNETKKDLEDEMKTAKEEYDKAVENDNMVLTAEEESNISFYEDLFTVIADKGWVADPKANDNDYMNNMLQNNQYYITTVSHEKDEKGLDVLEYNMDMASNLMNVYAVNDGDVQNEALVDYEYKKAIISEKESRVDTRMKNLETEQASINHMIKSIEGVKDDNIEKNFGIFA